MASFPLKKVHFPTPVH